MGEATNGSFDSGNLTALRNNNLRYIYWRIMNFCELTTCAGG